MLKNILIAVAVLITAVLVYAGTRPDTFRVERSVEIAAPADAVYGFVADFHRWQTWSPWEKLDPALRREYSGAEAGVGAVYAWAGNDAVGEGRMEIVEAQPPKRLGIQLDFLKPMASRNRAEFRFETRGDATTVHWTMSGPSPYVMKLVGLFADFDAMVGKDFERGLAELKTQVEALPPPAPAPETAAGSAS